MLDWLKKLGGAKPFENKVGLDAKSLELLGEDFAPLDELASGIAGRVIRYLLDGEGEVVLAEISALKLAAEKLRLRCTQSLHGLDGITARSEFFKSVHCRSAEFFRRLGLLYEAATRQARLRVFRSFGDPKLDWLEILLLEATQFSMNNWPRRCRACPSLTADLLEALIENEGLPRELLIRTAFQPELQRFVGAELEPVFVSVSGLGQSAVRHRQALLAALDHSDFKQRVYALTMMKKCQVPPSEFLDKLVALALSSSKQVRELAEGLLAETKSAALPLLERKTSEGDNEERAAAARLLWRWEGEKVRAFLTTRSEQEKNKKVAQVIQDLLAAVPMEQVRQATNAVDLPSLPPIPDRLPLGAETERAWLECFEQINAAIGRLLAGNAPRYQQRDLTPLTPDVIRKGFVMLQGGEETTTVFSGLAYFGMEKEFKQAVNTFWQRPELHPAHFVRFLVMVGALRRGDQQDHQILSYGYWLESLLAIYRRVHPEFGLRELGAAFQAVNLDPRRLGYGLLASYQEQSAPFGLPPSLVWPYWAEHRDLLSKTLEPVTGDFMGRWHQRHARRNAFHALATFPQPPTQLVPQLWELALGPKTERTAAQRCLEALSDKVNRLLTGLTLNSAESRSAAAEWLGRIGDKVAIAPLKAALEKEKNEITKGAIMSALEQLAVPVEQFLDRAGLLKESTKGLAKGIPEDLKWFPFEQLPAVHWEENGKLVEPEIVRWWLVQGFKLKSPEPGPLLRKYCASLKSSEREALGQFVLEAWLAKDTSPRIGAEAEKEAMRRAHHAVMATQQWAQWIKQNPQMAQQMSAYAPQQKTLQEHYEEILPTVQREPTGTAISSKGVLSLAGACVGSNAAPVIRQYLKDWYGMRVAQCRALLQMLVWVEHKTATQLLLAVGSRFRTKSIQEEANKQAQALAERKGWTVTELADRTIPTAGLDENGVINLDFGTRQFTAKLNEELEFALADADGKALKSLPDPRKDDDEAKAAETKKSFTAAKKELKSVVTMQRDRFYESMCTQRTWPFEDWNVYLNRHPIARYHCQRLVWAVIRQEKVASLFRPLPDGSLTDAADDPVTLQPDDLIRVAHECQITPEQSLAWRQHLKDYDVEPLFEQFGHPNFDLADERKQEDELIDFRGHLLEAFKLRARANKLGYTRGQAQDGGWFFDYYKRFPTLGMKAVIEFTGNGMPEENRTIALTTLRFERVASEGEPAVGGGKMPLGEVPPVLLSECWNAIRQIAAEGPGFDPAWEKKTQM